MTNIVLHGLIAKEFGDSFAMDLRFASEVVDALDCIRDGFKIRINELASEGLNYCIIIDGKDTLTMTQEDFLRKPERVDVVPHIIGSGVVGIGTAILSAVGIGGAAAGVAGTIAGSAALFSMAAFAIGSVTMLAVSIGLQMLLAPGRPNTTPGAKVDGPISATSRSLQESFTFSNKTNVASQGAPVPVGYGRLKIGSQVIQATTKSFHQNTDALSAMRKSAVNIGNEASTNSGGTSKRQN